METNVQKTIVAHTYMLLISRCLSTRGSVEEKQHGLLQDLLIRSHQPDNVHHATSALCKGGQVEAHNTLHTSHAQPLCSLAPALTLAAAPRTGRGAQARESHSCTESAKNNLLHANVLERALLTSFFQLDKAANDLAPPLTNEQLFNLHSVWWIFAILSLLFACFLVWLLLKGQWMTYLTTSTRITTRMLCHLPVVANLSWLESRY